MTEEIDKVGNVSQSRCKQIVAELRDVAEQQARGQSMIGEPRPEPCFTPRSAMTGRIPRAQRGRRCLSCEAAVGEEHVGPAPEPAAEMSNHSSSERSERIQDRDSLIPRNKANEQSGRQPHDQRLLLGHLRTRNTILLRCPGRA